MQRERHRADYDPDARYTRPDTLLLISNVEKAIDAFYEVARRDRAAFAAHVLLKKRDD
jgi:lipopolysaccharide biosynthesis regulator YciM